MADLSHELIARLQDIQQRLKSDELLKHDDLKVLLITQLMEEEKNERTKS